jgi:glutathione S-transferase
VTYTLYYSPGTASMAVHWTLIELGEPFDTVRLDFEADQQHDPAYLTLNPMGRVPTLVVDGQPYSESTALLMLLAEGHPEAGLAPAPGDPRRATWLETMVWLANNLQPPMRDWFYADKDGPPSGAAAVRDLFGDTPGVADFLAAMLMRWSRNMPHPANEQPALAAYLARMGALPSYAELCRREELTPWP